MKLSELNEKQKMWVRKDIKITLEVDGKVVELDFQCCTSEELRLKVRSSMTPDDILNSKNLSVYAKETALVEWLRNELAK